MDLGQPKEAPDRISAGRPGPSANGGSNVRSSNGSGSTSPIAAPGTRSVVTVSVLAAGEGRLTSPGSRRVAGTTGQAGRASRYEQSRPAVQLRGLDGGTRAGRGSDGGSDRRSVWRSSRQALHDCRSWTRHRTAPPGGCIDEPPSPPLEDGARIAKPPTRAPRLPTPRCRNRPALFVADVGARTETGPDAGRKQMTDTTSGPTRPFRFGIVAPFLSDVATWRDQVRRIADQGYSTVLMPDFPQLQPSPAAALAVAATVADVRVGTWVHAAPLRAPWLTAWEAHSLTMLTQGRFEMGIGAGRPGIEDELRDRGLPVPSPGQRLDLVRESVAALRALDGEQHHTPVAMAVGGAKARALAAEIADTVTFAMAPDEPRAAVVGRIREFRTTRD